MKVKNLNVVGYIFLEILKYNGRQALNKTDSYVCKLDLRDLGYIEQI